MKQLFVIFAVVLSVIVVGCSDKSSLSGPGNNSELTRILDKPAPGWGQSGGFKIDQLVYVTDSEALYHVHGVVDYQYTETAGFYTFRTSTQLMVTNAQEMGEEYLIVEDRNHEGQVGQNEEAPITDVYALNDSGALILSLAYDIANGVKLTDISLNGKVPPVLKRRSTL